ncbi:MAG: hypothetical protein KF754_05430 [Planctomycetes bacterium]|nr:hypothetical protein [Planctomycetota bacterium]
MPRWPTILFCLLLACTLASAQFKPIEPDKDGVMVMKGFLQDIPVRELIRVYESGTGKKVHIADDLKLSANVTISAPSEGLKVDRTVMLELIEETLRRSGFILCVREDGDLEVLQAVTAPARDVNEAQLAEAAAQERVRFTMTRDRRLAPLLAASYAPRGCTIDASRQDTLVITGRADAVRVWRDVATRTMESYAIVAILYNPPVGWTLPELQALIETAFRNPTWCTVKGDQLEVATFGNVHSEIATVLGHFK